jgi:uncharacterized membrane protein
VYATAVVTCRDPDQLNTNFCGSLANANTAFFYDGTTVTDLSPVVGARSVAQRLNDNGTIVGQAYSDGFRSGFAYAGGASIALPVSGYSEASGINNAGAIVGAAYLPLNGECCALSAYTYNGGVFTNLGTTADGYGSYAAAINDAGHVAGTNILDVAFNVEEPFVYSGGVMQNLGSFGSPMAIAGRSTTMTRWWGKSVRRISTVITRVRIHATLSCMTVASSPTSVHFGTTATAARTTSTIAARSSAQPIPTWDGWHFCMQRAAWSCSIA